LYHISEFVNLRWQQNYWMILMNEDGVETIAIRANGSAS
jgi:hypothetical protein